MKNTLILSSVLLSAASLSAVTFTADFTKGTNLSSSVTSATISDVDVSAGDMIVFAAATNKRPSANTIAFTSNAVDSSSGWKPSSQAEAWAGASNARIGPVSTFANVKTAIVTGCKTQKL